MSAPRIVEGLSNDLYHADKEWISSSQIKYALESARSYQWHVIEGRAVHKPSKAQHFGSIVHKLVLEPETFLSEYYVGAQVLKHLDMRKKADKEIFAAHMAEAGKRTLVMPEEYELAVQCRDSIMAHPDARRYLELPGMSEASIYVTLEHVLPTGECVPVRVRVRPDRLAHGHAIIDLKTTTDPSHDSFVKDVSAPWGWHYDLSAALYVRAVAQLTGEVLPFIFIAVRSSGACETAVYRMSEATGNNGNMKLNKALTTIIMSQRAGTWEYQKQMEEI